MKNKTPPTNGTPTDCGPPPADASFTAGTPAPADVPPPAESENQLFVVTRRACKVGGMDVEKGTKVAGIVLAPGVSLNWLVDALQGGILGEQH